MTSRAEHLFVAKLAESAQRYKDVVYHIRTLAEDNDPKLSLEERGLLAHAYKTITDNLRNNWRVFADAEKTEAQIPKPRPHRGHMALLRRQRVSVEKELAKVCREIVKLLDNRLTPWGEGEDRVFYNKMKGDYCRYLSDFAPKRERQRQANMSQLAYTTAWNEARATLDPIHLTRLGLALNFSVFWHDARARPDAACALAKDALDEALARLGGLPAMPSSGKDIVDGQPRPDVVTILELLRDNLVVWAAETARETVEE